MCTCAYIAKSASVFVRAHFKMGQNATRFQTELSVYNFLCGFTLLFVAHILTDPRSATRTKRANTSPFIGQMAHVGYTFAPRGWAFCDDQLLSINSNQALFSLIGTIYGGDGRSTFALPDLRGRVAVGAGLGNGLLPESQGRLSGSETVHLSVNEMPPHTHGTIVPHPDVTWPARRRRLLTVEPSDVMPVVNMRGGNQGFSIRQPYLGVNTVIALAGMFPPRSRRQLSNPDRNTTGRGTMQVDGDGDAISGDETRSRRSSDPYLGEIMMVGYNFAQRGWSFCDGQLLSIYSNQALFSLLGTIYGGDGRSTFALPDLRGRTAVHPGQGPGEHSQK